MRAVERILPRQHLEIMLKPARSVHLPKSKVPKPFTVVRRAGDPYAVKHAPAPMTSAPHPPRHPNSAGAMRRGRALDAGSVKPFSGRTASARSALYVFDRQLPRL
jgi:hypothetical protein